MGLEEVRTAPRSPWQTPYVERMIGTSAANASTMSSFCTSGTYAASWRPTSTPAIAGAATRASTWTPRAAAGAATRAG
jgi:hypothetical protein